MYPGCKRHFILHALLALLVYLPIQAKCRPEHLPLPAGYAYPRLPSVDLPSAFAPSASCATCVSDDMLLKQLYKHFTGFTLKADRYSGEDGDVTWRLFHIETGFQQIWLGPHASARLVQFKGGLLRLVLRQEIIRFQQETDNQGQHYFRCLNSDEWKIYRSGSQIAVAGEGRVFKFGSANFGESWRLEETYALDRKDKIIEIHYLPREGDIPDYVRLPDSSVIELEYTDSETIRAIKFPNGIVYKFIPGPSLQLSAIEEWQPVEETGPTRLERFSIVSTRNGLKEDVAYSKKKNTQLKKIRSWLFEHDSEGRIKRYLSEPCGHAYTVEHLYNKDDGNRIYTTVVKSERTGNRSWMRHTDFGRKWIYERGTADAETPLAELKPEQRTILEKIGITFRPVRFEHLASSTATLVRYDRFGHELGKAIEDQDGTIVREWSTGMNAGDPSIERDPADRVVVRQVNGKHIRYTWHDNDRLDTATDGQLTLTYSFDNLGRMTRATSDRGSEESWTYDNRDQLIGYSLLKDGTSKEQRSFSYDLFGRIVLVKGPGTISRNYTYTCSGPSAYKTSDGFEARFYYNEEGLLRKKVKEAGPLFLINDPYANVVQRYRYDNAKRLVAMKEDLPDGRSRIYYFDYQDGQRVLTKTEGDVTPEELTITKYTSHRRDESGQMTHIAMTRFGTPVLSDTTKTSSIASTDESN